MSAIVCPQLFLQFLNPNNSGSPAIGFKLFTYLAGTSTKTTTWTDSTQVTPNANPVILDSNGVANVWLDPTVAYKFVWAPANDTDPPSSPIRTVDNIQGGTAGNFTSLNVGAPISGPSLTVTSATGWGGILSKSTIQVTGPNSLTNLNQNVNLTQLLLHGYAAEFVSINGSAGADQKVWSFYADGSGNYNWRIENDALSTTYTWLQVSRTGNSGTFGSHQPIITFNAGYGNVTIASTIAGAYELAVFGGSTAGFSNGLHIGAGTTTGDNAFTIVDATNSHVYMNVRGDGKTVMGPSTTPNEVSLTVTGQASSTGACATFGGTASNFITVTDGAGMALVAQTATGNAGILGTSSNHGVQIISNNVARITVTNSGAVAFPSIGTTASAANAFLDNAASNNLLRSTSSIRYKQDVRDLPAEDAKRVLKLRPVTYRSKAAADDPSLTWYGLISEEVSSVDPRLCHYDEKGRPDGVQYDRLAVLLLGVVKKMGAALEKAGIEWDD